jgi:hypothetical protein
MGLIISTGFFKYIPPSPRITSTSTPTGVLGQTISIYGEDLDYVDNLIFGGERLNFNLTHPTQTIQFIVPENPDTGKLSISSNTFEITGENTLPFLPIFTIDNFDPKEGPEGTRVYLNGRVLNSIVSGNIYVNPILDDINYFFSGQKNTFNIQTSKNQDLKINLVQNVNLNSENVNFKIKSINPFDTASGSVLNLEYAKSGDLSQKYYKNHIFSMSSGIYNDFQIFSKTGINQSGSITINIPSGLKHTDYSVFYNVLFSGFGEFTHSYIDNKTTGSFDIIFSNNLYPYQGVNILLVNATGDNFSGFNYGGGIFERQKIAITPNVSDQIIYFDPVNRVPNTYEPFFLTSIEKISGLSIGNSYVNTNISNSTKDSFKINMPYASTTGNLLLNYIKMSNTGTNLSTFTVENGEYAWQKVYLITGDVSNYREKIPLSGLTKVTKNSLYFNIPNTEYYIDGNIELLDSTGFKKISNGKFTETPQLDSVTISGRKNENILLRGKSFKKPALLENSLIYDSCIIGFRYLDDIYKEKVNNFTSTFVVVNKNLLSGTISASSSPTGRYAIQIFGENGSIYE